MRDFLATYLGGAIVVLFLLIWPVAFLIPIGIFLYYRGKETLTKMKCGILLVLFIVCLVYNPILQRIVFDSLDLQRLNAMIETAQTHELIGKSTDDVYNLFGEPRDEQAYFNATIAEGGTCCDGPYKDRTDYLTWTYSPIPFYMFSRTFQISFTDGVVDDYREVIYEW